MMLPEPVPNQFADTEIGQFLGNIAAMQARNRRPGWATGGPPELLIHPRSLARHWTQEDADLDNPQVGQMLEMPQLCRMKDCFNNAARAARLYPNVKYVEGYAASAAVPFPVEHAWNLLPDGTIVDCTWCSHGARQPGLEYLGFVVPDEVVEGWEEEGAAPGLFNWTKDDELAGYLAAPPAWMWRRPSATTGRRDIGKRIGSKTWAHRDYAKHLFRGRAYDHALTTLAQQHPGHQWVVVRYDRSNGSFAFIDSPDFDEADEPTVGDSVIVYPDGRTRFTPQAADPLVWHHKHLFVGDDYTGFDSEESRARSASWVGRVTDTRRIGRQSEWKRVERELGLTAGARRRRRPVSQPREYQRLFRAPLEPRPEVFSRVPLEEPRAVPSPPAPPTTSGALYRRLLKLPAYQLVYATWLALESLVPLVLWWGDDPAAWGDEYDELRPYPIDALGIPEEEAYNQHHEVAAAVIHMLEVVGDVVRAGTRRLTPAEIQVFEGELIPAQVFAYTALGTGLAHDRVENVDRKVLTWLEQGSVRAHLREGLMSGAIHAGIFGVIRAWVVHYNRPRRRGSGEGRLEARELRGLAKSAAHAIWAALSAQCMPTDPRRYSMMPEERGRAARRFFEGPFAECRQEQLARWWQRLLSAFAFRGGFEPTVSSGSSR